MPTEAHAASSRVPGRSLFTWLAWGIGLGFAALHFVTAAYHLHDSLVDQAGGFAVSVIDRARTIEQLAGHDPQLLAGVSGDDFQVEFASAPPPPPARERRWSHNEEVRAEVDAHLRRLGLSPADTRVQFMMQGGDPELVVALPRHAKGDLTQQWLIARARAQPTLSQRRDFGVLRTTLLALLVLGLVLWATRRVTRFLPRFAAAAEQVGSFGAMEPLPLEGPVEVRRASAAFNEMQKQLQRHEAERSALLGAFSHDLRTLATRLALRVERIDDEVQRDKALGDVAAMTRIVDEALAYATDRVSDEPRVRVEITSLLQALVDDAQDVAGSAAALHGVEGTPGPLFVEAQAVALRRALVNLIDNAVVYGKSARVVVARDDDWLHIDIIDAGPGIPEADYERVLEPYVRVEASRNRETGGTGLGLAIANNVVRRHRGKLSFARTGDGFRVRVSLPCPMIGAT